MLSVGWQEGYSACKKIEWWGAGMVICLQRVADLHMTQLMPLPLTVTCFSKIQLGFTFLVPAHPGSPGKRAAKRVCCVFGELRKCVWQASGESGRWPCWRGRGRGWGSGGSRRPDSGRSGAADTAGHSGTARPRRTTCAASTSHAARRAPTPRTDAPVHVTWYTSTNDHIVPVLPLASHFEYTDDTNRQANRRRDIRPMLYISRTFHAARRALIPWTDAPASHVTHEQW